MLGVDDLVAALQQLNDDLEIPRLAALAERDRFDAVKADMAQAALDSGSPGFNPRVPDAGGDRRALRPRLRGEPACETPDGVSFANVYSPRVDRE